MKIKWILLTAFLAAGLIGLSFAGPYDDWPDDSICGWLEQKPTHAGYLGESKKRGLNCVGGKAVKGSAKRQLLKVLQQLRIKPLLLIQILQSMQSFSLQ